MSPIWPWQRRRMPDITQPAVPEGVVVYAIGDIHGRIDLLVQLHDLICDDLAGRAGRRAVGVFLGDYVDRGPAARDVLDWLARKQGNFDEIICLRGNHEAILQEFLTDAAVMDHWGDLGGYDTLYSYGVAPPLSRKREAYEAAQAELSRAIPAHHRNFLDRLPSKMVIGDYCFVHAGIRPGVALENQNPDDLIWIREPFLSSQAAHGKIIVHGHTPRDEPEVCGNRINIDTGAFATGRLTCLVLQGSDRNLLQTGS